MNTAITLIKNKSNLTNQMYDMMAQIERYYKIYCKLTNYKIFGSFT